MNRTKIVATLGPASNSPEIIKKMVEAGMSVARLNFSHGSYDDHAKTIENLRKISRELDTPITILQDLQGPKIRIGQLPNGGIPIQEGESLTLLPLVEYREEPNTAGIDYPYLAEEAKPGAQILLDDGLLELQIDSIQENTVCCTVVEGGILKSRKGVNVPSLDLRLPSMTEKDKQDLEFGLSQGVDWVSLSFVRTADDIRTLKDFIAKHTENTVPVIAKIEKPQAIEHLKEIIAECNGLMVARGDLGVEMSPEKVPMLQKRIVRSCNMRGIPVITATQMLDSMIREPRPTRAEASDVANAILDGTDAVMLSGESAVGKYPVKAVKMMAKIAAQVEPDAEFENYPPPETDETHALTEALNTIDRILDLKCIAAFTSSGYTARIASKERPKALVVAFTTHRRVYHRLNLIWGVKPILIEDDGNSFEELVAHAETDLQERGLVQPGDQILIVGGIPTKHSHGTNFLKLHRIHS
ncbi:MAG: pyruvate kinase [Cyanobacteria bacterium SID2]|nr:pyruvate kinase [Cyanobacteria bacterium SID2]MBP0002437.1 pyruvate kinase [Cyanobacteria bacterium SBC]